MWRMAGILFIICSYGTQAQSYFYKENIVEPDWLLEAGLGAGILNCRTDLGGKMTKGLLGVDWKSSRPGVSVLAITTFRHIVGFRIQLLHGSIGAADSLIGSGLPGSRFDRNLHFQSKLTELTLLIELFPFSLTGGKISTARIQPYLLSGPGWFWFNPKAKIDETWVELQPLHTEGQGFNHSGKQLVSSYKLNDLNIALGLGCRWEVDAFMHLRLEVIHRFLFTDYLDDVSTRYPDQSLFDYFLPPDLASLAVKASDKRRSGRGFGTGDVRGNPTKNDAYFQLQLALSVLLNRKKVL